MDRVDDLVPSEAAVILALTSWLPQHGSVMVPIDGMAFPVEEWRAIARRAGRVLGRPIRTRIEGDQVRVWLPGWPADDGERERQRADVDQWSRRLMRGVTGG